MMGRRIEGTQIFREDGDREDFLSRLAGLWEEGSVYFILCRGADEYENIDKFNRKQSFLFGKENDQN